MQMKSRWNQVFRKGWAISAPHVTPFTIHQTCIAFSSASTVLIITRGGGGTRNKYWSGCATPKRGVLLAGRAQNGGLRCGHNPKNRGGGGIRSWYCKKRGSYKLKLNDRRFLGAYLLIIFTFSFQHDQLVGFVLAGCKRVVLGVCTAWKRGC